MHAFFSNRLYICLYILLMSSSHTDPLVLCFTISFSFHFVQDVLWIPIYYIKLSGDFIVDPPCKQGSTASNYGASCLLGWLNTKVVIDHLLTLSFVNCFFFLSSTWVFNLSLHLLTLNISPYFVFKRPVSVLSYQLNL